MTCQQDSQCFGYFWRRLNTYVEPRSDYGSEGWGFESLRARHINHHNLGVQGAGPGNGVVRRLQIRLQTCDPERGVDKAFY
ncbi:hypothetical protein MCEKE4_01909 [Acidimicrobiia bacterium]